ncbi:phage holin family protein [Klebsiella oxytoca]|uniref:phage holin family protein n=1 Tax=Klebsiella oxytoca TaxID=571 RepID=UPI001CCF2FB1|nr:phage holin family protein [Klebsiella oxytoca]
MVIANDPVMILGQMVNAVLISDTTAKVNSILCLLIIGALMFYQRRGARHRPAISFLAYLTILVYATIPLKLIFGLYPQSHWLVVLANILICAAVLWARGNVARLVDTLRH